MARKPKPAKKGPGAMTLALAGSGVIAVVAWLAYSVPWLCMYVVAGFMPTLAAALVDPTRQKHDAIAVGTMSMGAMLPFLLEGLAQMGRTGGRDILSNAFAWVAVYAAALFAWGLCWLFPIVMNAIYERRAENRLRQLQRRQVSLEAEWGERVKELAEGPGAPAP
ncbi:MAG: hypothetical protein O9277_04310 [Magnetospirillum sp.]|nr:hypothetical protein [Magnetospirillum sp.]